MINHSTRVIHLINFLQSIDSNSYDISVQILLIRRVMFATEAEICTELFHTNDRLQFVKYILFFGFVTTTKTHKSSHQGTQIYIIYLKIEH